MNYLDRLIMDRDIWELILGELIPAIEYLTVCKKWLDTFTIDILGKFTKNCQSVENANLCTVPLLCYNYLSLHQKITLPNILIGPITDRNLGDDLMSYTRLKYKLSWAEIINNLNGDLAAWLMSDTSQKFISLYYIHSILFNKYIQYRYHMYNAVKSYELKPLHDFPGIAERMSDNIPLIDVIDITRHVIFACKTVNGISNDYYNVLKRHAHF